jgi:hypothetical protein
MFGWLTDKAVNKWAPATEADVPVEVQSLIAYRNSESEEAQALIAGGLDNVRWDLLSDAAKGPTVWAALAVVAQLFLKQVQTSLQINDWDNRSTIWLITLLTG